MGYFALKNQYDLISQSLDSKIKQIKNNETVNKFGKIYLGLERAVIIGSLIAASLYSPQYDKTNKRFKEMPEEDRVMTAQFSLVVYKNQSFKEKAFTFGEYLAFIENSK